MPVAVIDTNVWVSAFLNPHGFPARLIAEGRAGQFAVLTSPPLLAELYEVLTRPRIMRIRNTTSAEAEAYVHALAALARLTSVTGELQLCRDPDDDLLLETAVTGHATHIVSRDDDVVRDSGLSRRLQEYGIRTVTVSQFLAQVGDPG